MINTSTKLHLDCACENFRHSVRFTADPLDEDDPLIISMNLNNYLPWHTRLWYAFLYALGKARPNYDYDCALIPQSQVVELHKMLTLLIKESP